MLEAATRLPPRITREVVIAAATPSFGCVPRAKTFAIQPIKPPRPQATTPRPRCLRSNKRNQGTKIIKPATMVLAYPRLRLNPPDLAEPAAREGALTGAAIAGVAGACCSAWAPRRMAPSAFGFGT